MSKEALSVLAEKAAETTAGTVGTWFLWYFIISTLIYFLPYIMAKIRKHHQSFAIGLLNLLAGWTIIGWFVALIWAATAVERKEGRA